MKVFNHLIATCEALREEKDMLNISFEGQAERNDDLEQQNTELREENERLLKKDMDWLNSDVSLREENTELKQKVEGLEKTNKKMGIL